MKAKLLSSSLLLLLAVSPLRAEKFEGTLQAVTDPATQYTVIPGYYTKLSGTYNFNITEVYYSLSNQTGLLLNRQFWVIDHNGDIIYDGKGNLQPTATGMRYMNNFNCVIPESDAITTEGTYYFVIASDTPATTDCNAQLYTTGEAVHVGNLTFGPYTVVSELNDPVEAVISFSPTGEIDRSYFDADLQADTNPCVTLSVTNASMMGCGAVENNFTMKDPAGNTVPMSMQNLSAGELKMEFPTGYEPMKGTYTATVDFSGFSGFTADASPILFPSSPQQYSFTVTGFPLTDMTAKITPAPGVYEGIPEMPSLMGITPLNFWPVDYQQWPDYLTVTLPDLTTIEMPASRKTAVRGTQYSIPEGMFSQYGTYYFRLDFNGIDAIGKTGEFKGVTANLGLLEFTITFVNNEAKPEVPSIHIENVEDQDGIMMIEPGSSATVSFSCADSSSIYYTWNGGEETLYDSPFSIAEAGTLTYFSRSGINSSDAMTVVFEIKQKEEEEIVPVALGQSNLLPGEYIGFPTTDYLAFLPAKYRPESTDMYPEAVVTMPSGSTVTLPVAQATLARGARYNLPEGFFSDYGTYTVTIDFNGCKGIGYGSDAGSTARMGVLEVSYTFLSPESPSPAVPEEIEVIPPMEIPVKQIMGLTIVFSEESAPGFIGLDESHTSGTATVTALGTELEPTVEQAVFVDSHHISFPVEILDNGDYEIVVDLSGCRYTTEESAENPLPEKLQHFTLLYTVDATVGVDSVDAAHSCKEEYFTLGGTKTGKPAPGTICIRRADGKSALVIVK